MAKEIFSSVIEKMLGFEFVSDPRLAKYPIPKAPAKHPKDRPYPRSAMLVTPEMARDVLKYRVVRLDVMPRELRHDRMTGNRRFLITTLKGTSGKKGLTQAFLDKEIHPGTPQGVAFTEDGFLLDGQHRFAACALSGVPFEVPFMINTPWDTFSIIDVGRGRNAGQLLGDIPYPNLCAATARLVLPVLSGQERSKWSNTDATNQDIYDMVHGWSFFQGGTWMREVSVAAANGVPPTPLAASTVMALAAGADPFRVQEFLNGLKLSYKDGFPNIGIKGSDPRYLLMRLYRNDRDKRSSAEMRRLAVAHCRRAMHVWLEATSERPIELAKLPSPAPDKALPAVWRADDVRKFHLEEVS